MYLPDPLSPCHLATIYTAYLTIGLMFQAEWGARPLDYRSHSTSSVWTSGPLTAHLMRTTHVIDDKSNFYLIGFQRILIQMRLLNSLWVQIYHPFWSFLHHYDFSWCQHHQHLMHIAKFAKHVSCHTSFSLKLALWVALYTVFGPHYILYSQLFFWTVAPLYPRIGLISLILINVKH